VVGFTGTPISYVRESLLGSMGAKIMSIRRLRDLIQQMPADVRIGKNGISEGVISEIKRRLKDKGYVKVKILKNAPEIDLMDRKEIAEIVARRTSARLIDVRGRTFVLLDPKINPEKLIPLLESKVIKA